MGRLFVRALTATLLCASFVAAQQISGSITGVVKDSQQAAVVNAKVVLTSVEQGTTREGSTGSDGSFVFTQIQPAIYNKLQIVRSEITSSAIGAACLVWHGLR